METKPFNKQLLNLEEFVTRMNKEVFDRVNDYLSERTGFLERMQKHSLSLNQKQNTANAAGLENEYIEYHAKNLSLIDDLIATNISSILAKELIDKCKTEISTYRDQLPTKISDQYTSEDLNCTQKANWFEKVYCFFEKNRIKIGNGWQRLFNFFRRLVRLKPRKKKQRQFRMDYKNIIEKRYLCKYVQRLSQFIDQFEQTVLKENEACFNIEFSIINNAYKLENTSFQIHTSFDIENDKLLLKDFHANEIEILKQLLRRSRMGWLAKTFWLRYKKKKCVDYQLVAMGGNIKLWQNTYAALHHDWQFREILFRYVSTVNGIFLHTKKLYDEKIKSILQPEIVAQKTYIDQLLNEIEGFENVDIKEIRKFFTTELYKQNKKKAQKEESIQKIHALINEMPNLLNKFELEISEKLQEFPEEIGVVNNPDYTKKIKASEIKYYAPAEVISFEYLPKIKDEFQTLKKSIEKKVKELEKGISEFDQVIDYYLDSAIVLTNDRTSDEHAILNVVKEGINRLAKNNKELTAVVDELILEDLSTFTSIKEWYLNQVKSLDDNNNVLNIYLRLLRSKTLVKTKSRRGKIVLALKNGFFFLFQKLQTNYTSLKSRYKNVRKRLGTDTSENVITSEISNYLADIQKKMYRLPVIYQHLFENIPVKEPNLFLHRKVEMEKLDHAYQNWINENYAATLLSGEHGSGKTSLIHHFSKHHKTNYQIVYIDIERFYYTEKDFYALINEIFNQTGMNSDADIDAYLATNTGRKIIIIDGVERMFLRVVNGFSCIHKLLTFIVSTNTQFFWICSISKYALGYLKKSINLSDYFDFEINMDTLSYDQIKEIVLKRNRLGGYKLNYISQPTGKEKDKYNKLTQSEIEDLFFKELNKFAQSNIQLSLNYWMQSVNSIDEYDVKIGDFSIPDFSFLESFSFEKMYTLYLIILHGRITIDQHALIFNQPRHISQKILFVLKEDAVLLAFNAYFKLNGILYNHVVKLLKNKNLIH